MLAHNQGGPLNVAQLARNLNLTGRTVGGYIDLLADLLLVRRLPALRAAAPPRTLASFYRTARGAEIDLVLEVGAGRGVWAIEIKRSAAASTSKGFNIALEDIQADKAFVVHGGEDRYFRRNEVEAINLLELVEELM